ncbi:MAG: cupin domain-containing protein [Candidatus Dormibacteraeota bacterium]|nr:cupin domain-containing protein [Candidatus Dormibacteraeota bacterium]
MQTVRMADGPGFDPDKAVAAELMRGERASVLVIRVGAGQSLPAHRHGESDLMLYVAEGTATLGGDETEVLAPAGTIAHFRGEEVLEVRCESSEGVTLLAFLAPPFPARVGQ